MQLILAFAIGIVFGTGIVVSGMSNPAKVVNFFDFAGTWDPSLAFVMASALTVTFFGYRWVLARRKPLLAHTFNVPLNRSLDARLLAGSAVFGIGWGISGFCPGGALPAIGTGNGNVLIFVLAMIGGIVAARFTTKLASRPARTADAART